MFGIARGRQASLATAKRYGTWWGVNMGMIDLFVSRLHQIQKHIYMVLILLGHSLKVNMVNEA